MKIHVLSDLHNEFSQYKVSPAANAADVVVLAGDIDLGMRGLIWAEQAFTCPVIYVPGNHEFYGDHLENLLAAMHAFNSERVRVLDMNELVVGSVRFLGATAWTNFTATGNPFEAEYQAQRMLNDFRAIRVGNDRLLHPRDLITINAEAKAWLRSNVDEKFDGKTVVITHHAPVLKSLENTPYEPSHLDAAFSNAWDELFDGGGKVDLWIHGHTHTSVDYEAGGTRVISNQRGYPGEATGFNPDLIIEL